MLLLQDSCVKELARVISASYQENYRKFEAHVIILGMKPNATSKFSGNCFVHDFIWDQRGPWHSGPLAAPLNTGVVDIEQDSLNYA